MISCLNFLIKDKINELLFVTNGQKITTAIEEGGVFI